MMGLGDDVRPFTPVAAVASQFVLTARPGDDAGDAVRVLMYPGELSRGLATRSLRHIEENLGQMRQALASEMEGFCVHR